MLTPLFAFLAVSSSPLETPLYPGLGSHTRKVSTRSALSQRYFDQGLNLLYAFNHDEAAASFRAAISVDSNCAMAYWGLATAQGPHINNTAVEPAREKMAVEALKKAKLLPATPVERALIQAATARFRYPVLPARFGLDKAYASAMRSVAKRYPKDSDVSALYAESLMDLRPWDLWTHDGKPQPGTEEILRVLETSFTFAPNHPLANHLYIHAVEASPNPARAITAADRLRDSVPGLGHQTHMPSHIDVRTGSWQKAIISNAKAIRADEEYSKIGGKQGFYGVYRAHNRHMLAFAAMMTGQRKLALSEIDAMVAAFPKSFLDAMGPAVDGWFAMPIEVRMRFGMWDEVLSAPEPPATYPLSRALRHYARGVAFAAKGKRDEARFAQAEFEQAAALVPKSSFFGNNPSSMLIEVARGMLDGELLIQEGSLAAGIATLQKAAKAEDQLRYDEPPDWILPVRHPLGAALLRAGRYQEAVKVYQEDLRKWPANGWSLYGVSEAFRGLANSPKADSYRRQFAKTWKSADTPIDSSCLCLPKLK